MGVKLNLPELSLLAAQKRAQAVSAREVVNRLSDEEERREILRYADNLNRDATRLDAEIAAKQAEQNTTAN